MPLTDDEAIDAVLTPRAPVAPASAPAITARAPSADDAAVEAALSGTTERASQNLAVAARMAPEQAAKVHKMARDAGLSPWAVEGNEALVMQDLTARRNRELIAKNPVLATAIANNPAFADVAFDDMENADKISKAWDKGGFGAAARIARQTADRQQQIIEQQAGGSVKRAPQAWLKPELEDAFLRGVAKAGVNKTIIATELGLYDKGSVDLAVQLGQEMRIAARRPMPEDVAAGLAEIKEAGKGTFGEALAAVVRNPRAVLEVSAESLAASSPGLVAGVAGSMAGPLGAGAGAAMGSFAVEYASVLSEALGDTTDPQEIYAAMNDDKKMAAARKKAVTRGVPIAVFDGLTAGLAGRLLAGAKGTVGSVAGRAAGELGVQAVGGGAGEAVAGALVGEFNWGDVLLEAFAEIPSALTEVPSNYAHYRHLQAKQAAGADGAALLSTMQQAAESLTLRRDPVAFNAFFQEVAGDSTVFVDREQLLQVFAEAKLDINEKLPSAAAQLNQATPEGIEIPIAELVTNLSGSGIEEQLVQHLRMEPNAMTIAEGNTKADEAKAFIEHTVEQIMGAKERSDQFLAEVKQIEDDVSTSLNAAGAYGTGANKTNARIMGAWYATVADKWGVTPLQIRDGWTAADGTKYAGWKPQILGAPTAPAQGPELSQGFDHGYAMLNIGLDVGAMARDQQVPLETVKAAIEKLGAKVVSGEVVESEYEYDGKMVKEMTFVPHLNRALTDDEVNQLAVELGREAIGQYAGGEGKLLGPNAAAWGAFNPEFFKDQSGVSLAEAQKGLTQGSGLKAVDINSPEFKAWFGKSKVVSEGGNPLRMYHTTYADFAEFEQSRKAPDLGFHFGTTAQANDFPHKGASTMPVYLSIQNPLRMRDVFGRGNMALGEIALELQRLGLVASEEEAERLWSLRPMRRAVAAMQKIIQDAGYDGVVYKNTHEGLRAPSENEAAAQVTVVANSEVESAGNAKAYIARRNVDGYPVAYGTTSAEAMRNGVAALVRTEQKFTGEDSYICFRPEQIKSAISNTGEFSNENPSLLFAGGPKKGSFSPATFELRLLADADLSTFLHEASHFFLAAYTDMAAQPGAPKALVDEVNAILGHLFKTVPGGAVAGGDLGQEMNYKAVDTNSPEFKAWFGDSKVVDAEGKPLVVYHATKADFDVFNPNSHFGSKAQAEAIAANLKGKVGKNVIPVYLSAQKLKRVKDVEIRQRWDAEVAKAKKQGYDGLVYDNEFEGGGDSYVAFSPEQIKSAIGNTGAFSNEDPNILAQEVGADNTAPGPLPEGQTPLDIWRQMSLDQQRPYHEAWAEQFEQYAMTGKAPSLELDSAFKTFANWLKKIYVSLKTFVATHTGGKLQPDTAAFFDRMLATEEQIATANAARSYTAMFKNAADAGMSDQKFADYMALSKEQAEDAEAMLRSRSLRDMVWLQRTRTKFIAAKQAEAAEMRKAVRDEVEKELAATPLRRAAKWLKHGEMTAPGGDTIKVLAGNKLQISDVEDIFPEKSLTPRPDISKLGYGQYGMLAKEGLAPDLVAEMFGYRSGEALVRDLLEMKPFKEEVESLTDTRMLEEHSEMLDPDAIAKEADAAIHNDARTRMVATELAALNNKVGSPAALMKAAKAYATQIIETKTSKTLKPWTFAAAETRAGKAALALLRKGKRDEAAEQKRVELVNHTAAKLAYQAEAEITKIIAKFRKIAAYSDKHSSVKSRDFATVQAVRALISQVGIGAKGEKAAAYLELVQKYDPATGLLLKDAIDTFGETDDWQNIKLADLRQLAENVDNLWGFAKATRGFMVGKERLELEDVAGQVVAALRDYAPEGELGKTHAVTEEDKLSIKVSGMKSVVARIEIWAQRVDNTPGIGAVARYLVNTIKSPENDYMVQREAAYADIEARLRKIAPALKPRLIDATEDLGYVFGHGPGKSGVAELLAAMLHTGNPSNKQKLLLGRKGEKTLKDGTKVEMPWGAVRKDGTLDTTQWDKFIKKMQDEGVLTKELYDFVQESWDMFESIKPQMQAANMAVLGKFFGEITAEKFSTPFGEYAGGYVPALTDRDIVHDQDVRELDLEALGGISRSLPAPANGMTKERANAYNKPLALDLGLLPMQMNKALLFAHMAAPVAQVQRLVNTTEVKEALDKAFPGARVHMLMPWLARAATHRTSLLSPEFGPTGQVWTYLRAATGMSRMMGNVSNAVQQYTGLATATGMLEDKKQMIYAAPALLWIGDLRSKVKAMSPYMAQRMATELSAVSGSIHEILLNPSVFQQARKWTFQHGYFLQQWADLHVSPVVWVAAYNSIKSVHPDTTEQDARDYADRIVRLSQGATGPTDISTFEAGHPFAQLLTQFSGWGLGQGQTIYSALATNFRRDVGLPEKYSKATGIVLLMVLVPSMLAELIATGFRGGPDDDDRDGQLIDDWLHQVLLLGPVKFLAGGVPVLGKGIQTALNMWNDKPYDDRLSVAPAVGTIEGVARSPVSVYEALFKDGKPSKAIKDVSEIGTLFGLPTAAAARPISYWADVAAGRVQPTGLWDATRGTITGAASPASKQ